MKIIDWDALWLAVLQSVAGVLITLGALASGHPIVATLFAVVAVLGFVALRQTVMGTVFEADAVSFHYVMMRRRVTLAEVRAANCEFTAGATPLLPLTLALAVMGGGGSKRGRQRSDGTNRAYLVNLSDSCGSAQVRFYGKRWRDAFLMQLREQAPRCRITRWS